MGRWVDGQRAPTQAVMMVASLVAASVARKVLKWAAATVVEMAASLVATMAELSAVRMANDKVVSRVVRTDDSKAEKTAGDSAVLTVARKVGCWAAWRVVKRASCKADVKGTKKVVRLVAG